MKIGSWPDDDEYPMCPECKHQAHGATMLRLVRSDSCRFCGCTYDYAAAHHEPMTAPRSDPLAALRGRALHDTRSVGGPWTPCGGDYGHPDCECESMARHYLDTLTARAADPDGTLLASLAERDRASYEQGVTDGIAMENAQLGADAAMGRLSDVPIVISGSRSGDALATALEALATIQDICKPMSIDMSGQPVWFDGGTPAGGGSRERIWRICEAAIANALESNDA